MDKLAALLWESIPSGNLLLHWANSLQVRVEKALS